MDHRLATIEEVEGLGPKGNTVSVCTADHAEHAYRKYEEFVKNPGPVVIGDAQFSIFFGPAYEYAFIVDADLRKRKTRDKVPMTYITSEPYIGHLGLGGVGDSKGLLESELRQRHISWIVNAKILRAETDKLIVAGHNNEGQVIKEHEVPFDYSIILPAFKGVDAVANVENLCNPRGFVFVDEHQRNFNCSIWVNGRCVETVNG